MRILLFDKSKAERDAIELLIRNTHETPNVQSALFCAYPQEDVFKVVLPKDPDMAFFTICNMANVEAARQFTKLYGRTPLVIVGDSGEYSIEAYSLGARYYLKRPIDGREMQKALLRCASNN